MEVDDVKGPDKRWDVNATGPDRLTSEGFVLKTNHLLSVLIR